MLYLLFFFNTCICLGAIWIDKSKYSLNKIFFLFSLLFLTVFPCYQWLINFFPWNYRFSEDSCISAQALVLLWNFIFFFSYRHPIVEKRIKYVRVCSENLRLPLISKALIIIVFLFILIKVGNISNLIYRGQSDVAFGSDGGSFQIIFNNCLKSVIIVAFAYLLKRNHLIKDKKIFFFFLLVFITNFPLATTRFWTAALYLGITLIFLEGKKYPRRLIDFIMLFSTLIIFPFLQLFKWLTITDLLNGKVSFAAILLAYKSGDFDALSMIVRCFDYVEHYGYSYGAQLVGVPLFWVPRAIFPSKPIPSGELIAIGQYADFTNLSFPLISEFYLNFGIFGVCAGAIFTSLICRYLDRKYVVCSTIENRIPILSLVYPFSLMLFFFILRGSLHCSFILSVEFISFAFFYFITSEKRRLL